MDEQENQQSNQPERESAAPSEDGGKRRSTRRRNRKRRGRNSEAPATQPEIKAEEQAPEQQPEERPRTGNAAKPKRRNNPRRTAMPDLGGPEEVVRPTAPTIAPLQPMRLRKIDPDDTSEPVVGCPMLTRTRLEIPFRGNQRVARCSVGWSIHDEDEVLFCMHTPTAAQCWKEHPEYVEALVERLRPIIEEELAAGE